MTAITFPATGPAAAGQGLVQPRSRPRLVAVPDPDAVTMRITRRGRLAITCSLALCLVLAVAVLLGSLRPAGASSEVVVQPGATLSELAAEHLPDRPVSQAITDIQQANRLSDTSLAAGQALVIP